MENNLVIWHNPACSKSRQTLQLLRDRGFQPVEINYQKSPPSPEEIAAVLKKLDLKPRELMRKGQSIYKELNLKDENDDSKLIDAMFHYPILIERPVVIHGDKAAIGRPPESVLSIL